MHKILKQIYKKGTLIWLIYFDFDLWMELRQQNYKCGRDTAKVDWPFFSENDVTDQKRKA